MKKQLSKTEVEAINQELHDQLHVHEFLKKKDRVELSQNGNTLLFVNNIPSFIKKGYWIPHLKLLQQQKILKEVIVDMGAVKFITNGADVMRPGIVGFAEGVLKDELVAIVDQTHHKPLAVGQMLFAGEEANAQKQGKIIKNLHWVGDEVWKAS